MKTKIKKLMKEEAILFAKYLANTIDTGKMKMDDIEERIPKIYEEFLGFCGTDMERDIYLDRELNN